MILEDMTEERLQGITLIYGPAGAGKSTLALQTLAGRAIYISTSKNFSVERLQSMRPDADALIEKLVLFEPMDLLALEKAVETAVKFAPMADIIVIDSIATHLRASSKKLSNLALHRMLADLSTVSIPVVITSEVYDYFKEAGGHQFVGGDMLRLASRTIIELKEGTMTLKKHPQHTGRSWEYAIHASGLAKA